jgi:hypothetical protein
LADWRSKCLKSGHDQRYFEVYEAYLAEWAITIGHELVHLFISFLGGDKERLTPISLAPLGCANSTRGEAGRMWELRALGGCVSYLRNTHSELLGAGSLWLLKDNEALMVTPEAIMGFVMRGTLADIKALPAETDWFEQISSFPWALSSPSSSWIVKN